LGTPVAVFEAGARATLHGRWLALRDRCLGSERFRQWAARFPFTRRLARRRAAALFDLVAGFVYSQVLLAAVRLRLFDHLARGPLPIAEVARRVGVTEDAAQRLLDAAEALSLVERRAGATYGLGPMGATLVGNGALTAMIEHHAALYADLADPVALLRGERGATALADYWAYSRDPDPRQLDASQVDRYSALMAASQPLVADEILDAHDFNRHRTLLDVGGGDGAFLERVAARAPRLRLMLFDLPAVADRARGRLARVAAARTEVTGGDFLHDRLPAGADLVTLVRVVHDHDDDAALALLHRVRMAIEPGGTLLLAEPMADTAGARAMGGAYFGFYLLAMGQGRPRSRARLIELLRQAGFERAAALPTRQPLQTGLLRAQAPRRRAT
jgi:demethylspheroidene O-methyltransferase